MNIYRAASPKFWLLNISSVCIEKADIVVKEPKKPIIKKSWISDLISAKNPKRSPTKKHPRMFTLKVPIYWLVRKYFETASVNKYLEIAPRAPPVPINIIFINLLLIYQT
jgi:hypothetical protein